MKLQTFFIRCLTIFFLFISLKTISQEKENHSFFQDKLNNYFNATREKIHLHLNKDQYISNETIWFKSYVIDKSSGLLNTETTNVYVSLLDSQKKVLQTKLFLSRLGTLNGSWELDKDLSSGTYYLHVFTNFMNNFIENESSIFKIEVLNPQEFALNDNFELLENAVLELNVEGGNFIYECDNKFGVKLTDCRGNGIKTNNIKVLDSKNNLINQFSTNSEGYGAFYVINTQNEDYRIVIENSKGKFEKKLPNVSIEGLTLNCNVSSDNEKIIIEIKTNSSSLNKIKDKKFKLLIHKHNEFIKYEIKINEKNEKIIINRNQFFDGINYIRLLDEDNNSISDRIIYNHFNNENSLTINKLRIENDSILFKGKINNLGNLSISVLPENTTSTFKTNSIESEIKLNSYLNNSLNNYKYYFNNFNRNKNYELDLVLLSQKELKYDWKNILNKQPETSHEFQKGINIAVKLNQDLSTKNNKLYTGNLIIPSENIIIQEKMSNNNEMIYKNIIVRDSTEMIFTLNVNNEIFNKPLKTYVRIMNSFNAVKVPEINYCNPISYIKKDQQNFEFPINKNTIKLKEVEVIQKRDTLKYINESRNRMANGFKLDPERDYMPLLQYIAKNGYEVFKDQASIRIFNISGERTVPIIIIDDIQIRDHTDLQYIWCTDIDEIYFNRYDNSNRTQRGEEGVIKIYMRKDYNSKTNKQNGLKVNIITNAFQMEKPFINLYDSNFNVEAFKKHGTIHWIPNIYTDKDGNFQFKTPILEQEKILLNVQGIDSVGNLYSENIIINVKE